MSNWLVGGVHTVHFFDGLDIRQYFMSWLSIKILSASYLLSLSYTNMLFVQRYILNTRRVRESIQHQGLTHGITKYDKP